MDEFEIELKNDFLEESEDLLNNAEDSFMRLEMYGDDPDLLNEIFRVAHNLKGTSKAVGFGQLAELTHEAENLILKLKSSELEVSSQVVSTLLEFKDKVVEMINGLKEDFDAQFDISLVVKNISILVDKGNSDSIGNNEEEVKSGFVIDLDSVSNPAAVQSLRDMGMADEEIAKSLGIEVKAKENNDEQGKKESENSVQVEQKLETKDEVKVKRSKALKAKPDESIRVKLSRIDKLNNIVGELVILQTVLNQRRFESIQDDLSNKSIGMMSKLFKEVQELSMSLRMVPLKATFQKMSRIVRDTSATLNKDIEFHIHGENTEVDKLILESIVDPLVHMVRNSVDHGIESLDKRIESGKESVGNVELMAFHEGGNLVIQITDDGGGIDPEVIYKKAVSKNIIKPGQVLNESEILQLVFHPGFSTKEQVSEVSGRGVGMDVVQSNIKNLGGEIKVMSKVGQGTSFKLVLPLTLAIIEGMVIESSSKSFVVPLSQIYELVTLDNKSIENFSTVGKILKLRGEVMPLFSIDQKLRASSNCEKERGLIIVVKSQSGSFGVLIDDVMRQQQIVIKNLGEDVRGTKGFIGAAILGDGKPALILDLYELFRDEFKQNKSYKKLMSEKVA